MLGVYGNQPDRPILDPIVTTTLVRAPATADNAPRFSMGTYAPSWVVEQQLSETPQAPFGPHTEPPQAQWPLFKLVTRFADASEHVEHFTVEQGTVDELSRHGLQAPLFVNPRTGEPLWSDAHFHPTNYAQRGQSPQQLLKLMNDAGVRRSTLMRIPTTVNNPICDAQRTLQRNHHCGESYYIPARHLHLGAGQLTDEVRLDIVSSSELFIDSSVDSSNAFSLHQAWLSMAERDRFDPMITGLHLGSPLAGDALLHKLFQHPGVFTGVGEVTLHKELVEDMFAGKTQANLSTHVASLKDFLGVAGVIGMPVVIHCDIDSLANQQARGTPGYQPAHLAGLRQLFADPAVQSTALVWAHGGGLGRFITEPPGHLDELQRLLDRHPNLSLDISWSHAARQLTRSPAAIAAWQALIERNPERILFGSDALAPQSDKQWVETRELYRALLDGLTPSTQARVLTGNYDRTIAAARENVRAFEKHVLTPTLFTMLNTVDGPRTVANWLQPYADACFARDGVDRRGHTLLHEACA